MVLRPWRLASVLAAASLLLVSAGAAAQGKGSVALDQLEPTPAGDAFVGVPSPYARGELVPRGVVLFDLGADPDEREDLVERGRKGDLAEAERLRRLLID